MPRKRKQQNEPKAAPVSVAEVQPTTSAAEAVEQPQKTGKNLGEYQGNGFWIKRN